jgi:fluoroacetyl-CoA thioesterase
MKPTLQPGLQYEFKFRVPENKLVPSLYPEALEFQEMPRVFATGFMVGLLEWTCIKAINPHLDWPAEQSVGTQIDVSHTAATPPGCEVTVRVRLTEMQGKRLKFEVEAHDGVDSITKGTHERYVIDRARFVERVQQKAAGMKT